MPNFANGSVWLLGRGVFLSVICRDFLYLCGCLVLRCFLEASSIYGSITKRKEAQRLIMKVGSINMFAFLSVLLYL